MSTPDFFRSRLDAMVDPRHPLVVLAGRLDWEQIEARISPLFLRDGKRQVAEGADLFGPTPTTAGVHPGGRPRLAVPADGVAAVPQARLWRERRVGVRALERERGLAVLQRDGVLHAEAAVRSDADRPVPAGAGRSGCGGVAVADDHHGGEGRSGGARRAGEGGGGHHGAGEGGGVSDRQPAAGRGTSQDRVGSASGGGGVEAELREGRPATASAGGWLCTRPPVPSVAPGAQAAADDPGAIVAGRAQEAGRVGRCGAAEADDVAGARRTPARPASEGQGQAVCAARTGSGVHRQRQGAAAVRVRGEGERGDQPRQRAGGGRAQFSGQPVRRPYAGRAAGTEPDPCWRTCTRSRARCTRTWGSGAWTM